MMVENRDSVFSYLKSECDRLGFDHNSYRIGNAPSPGLGEISFDFRDGKWAVFLYERGREEDFALFDKKRDAVKFFVLELNLLSGKNCIPDFDFSNLP